MNKKITVFKNINKVFWGECAKKRVIGNQHAGWGERFVWKDFLMEKNVENFMPGQPPFGRLWRKNKK